MYGIRGRAATSCTLPVDALQGLLCLNKAGGRLKRLAPARWYDRLGSRWNRLLGKIAAFEENFAGNLALTCRKRRPHDGLRGNFKVERNPMTLIDAASRNTKVKDPVKSAR